MIEVPNIIKYVDFWWNNLVDPARRAITPIAPVKGQGL